MSISFEDSAIKDWAEGGREGGSVKRDREQFVNWFSSQTRYELIVPFTKGASKVFRHLQIID